MKTIINLLIGVALLWFVLSAIGNIGKYEGQSAEDWSNKYDETSGQVDELQTQVDDLKTALQEANNNIENANTEIEYVKSRSGDSYESINSAIDSLNTISTVSEP